MAIEGSEDETSEVDEPEPQEGSPGHSDGFFIVGVGASAGGLDALASLLGGMVLDSTAVVVVQHLSPAHESVLPALLSRASTYKVQQAEDGQRIEPNNVYVIPPGADLALLRGACT